MEWGNWSSSSIRIGANNNSSTDTKGLLRFKKTDEGDFKGYVSVYKYDALDRLVGTGSVPKAQFTQANADNGAFPQDANLAIGYIQDELTAAAWLSRTGMTLTALGFDPALLKKHQGKMAGSYRRNLESSAPGLSPGPSRLAATFYSYDDKGRVTDIYKYLGPAPAGKKWHRIQYAYDDQERVFSKTVYVGLGETNVATRSTYTYNNKDQVVSILDKANQELARYAYDFRG